MTYANGEIHEGTYQKGKREGQGVHRYLKILILKFVLTFINNY
jgi:hypothetical protein